MDVWMDADSKQPRLLIQPAPNGNAQHGSIAQWSRFWKAIIPHKARTIWWWALQGKITTGSLQTRIWRQQQSPACPICQHPAEDQNHFFSSAQPNKKSASRSWPSTPISTCGLKTNSALCYHSQPIFFAPSTASTTLPSAHRQHNPWDLANALRLHLWWHCGLSSNKSEHYTALSRHPY